MAAKFDIEAMRANRDAGTPGQFQFFRGQADWGMPRSNVIMPEGCEEFDYDTMIAQVHSRIPYCAGASRKYRKQSSEADANALRFVSVPDMEAEIERLCEQRENAAQAMAETASSWEQRCYSIMAALDQNFGEFEKNAPEVGSYFQINLARKDAEIKCLTAENADLRAALPAPQVKPLVWTWHNPPEVWRARSICGEYEVDTCGSWTRTRGEVTSKVFDGGKAAAQADYEARIRTALVGTEGGAS